MLDWHTPRLLIGSMFKIKITFISFSILVFSHVAMAQIQLAIDFGSNVLSTGNWTNVSGGAGAVDAVDLNTGLDSGIDIAAGGFNASTGANWSSDWVTAAATDDLVFITSNTANLAFFTNVPDGT